MLVRKSSRAGFDKIATPEISGTGFPVPEKTPYIMFRMPMRDGYECDTQYYDALEMGGFALLSLPRIDKDGYAYITITNEHKIVRAIKYFFAMREYRLPENRELFLKLKKFADECKRSEAQKKTKFVPPKSKAFENYVRVNHPQFIQSRSKTFLFRKKSKPDKEYVFKLSATGRSITEIEAFNGLCYQLLLGRRHPKVRSVHDADGKRRGVISQLLPGFQSVYQKATTQGAVTKETIVESEMVKVWVAGYVEEEMDFHADNYGFDDTGFCVKIDDDRSTWPLTAKYVLIDPELGDEESEAFHTPPVTDFTVTKRDIADFPFLTDARPCYWCDKGDTAKCFENDAIRNALQEKKFNDDKFYIFLKRILIPDSVYKAMGDATISNANKRSLLVSHKIKKTKELETELLRVPAFQVYVMNNPDAIKQICAELSEYNHDFKKAKNQSLLVNCDEVRKKFHRLRRQVYFQRGVDLFVVQDVVKDAFIGAGIGLLAIGIVAVIVLSVGVAIPTFGLTLGGLVAALSLVVGVYSMIAASVGAVTKRHYMKNRVQMPHQDSSSRIFTALGVAPLAPAVSPMLIPSAVAVPDIYFSSSSDDLGYKDDTDVQSVPRPSS